MKITFVARWVFLCFLLAEYILPMVRQAPNDSNNFQARFEVFELPGRTGGNTVLSIVQDTLGFLWFASHDGLHRYDGQRTITYHNDPLDENSLSSSLIECMIIDSRNMLWLGHLSNGGVNSFNPITEEFTRYRSNSKDSTSLSNNQVFSLGEDLEGNIWAGTLNGLNRLNRETGQFKQFLHDTLDTQSLSHNLVASIYLDKQGTLWIGTG